MNLDTVAQDPQRPDSKDSLHIHSSADNPQTLRDSVEIAMRNYFAHLEGQDVANVYQMVMSEVEAPMLRDALQPTRPKPAGYSASTGVRCAKS